MVPFKISEKSSIASSSGTLTLDSISRSEMCVGKKKIYVNIFSLLYKILTFFSIMTIRNITVVFTITVTLSTK